MKYLLLISFVCISSIAYSQKIALLDMDFKRPILYTDSLTLEQATSNYFPLQVNAFDTFYTNLKTVKDLLSNKLQRAKMKSFELHSGASIIKLTGVSHAYGDSYNVEVLFKADDVATSYTLGDGSKLNKSNIKKIDKMMTYMKNASALFKSDYVEMTPHYYNVIIYK